MVAVGVEVVYVCVGALFTDCYGRMNNSLLTCCDVMCCAVLRADRRAAADSGVVAEA